MKIVLKVPNRNGSRPLAPGRRTESADVFPKPDNGVFSSYKSLSSPSRLAVQFATSNIVMLTTVLNIPPAVASE